MNTTAHDSFIYHDPSTTNTRYFFVFFFFFFFCEIVIWPKHAQYKMQKLVIVIDGHRWSNGFFIFISRHYFFSSRTFSNQKIFVECVENNNNSHDDGNHRLFAVDFFILISFSYAINDFKNVKM